MVTLEYNDDGAARLTQICKHVDVRMHSNIQCTLYMY